MIVYEYFLIILRLHTISRVITTLPAVWLLKASDLSLTDFFKAKTHHPTFSYPFTGFHFLYSLYQLHSFLSSDLSLHRVTPIASNSSVFLSSHLILSLLQCLFQCLEASFLINGVMSHTIPFLILHSFKMPWDLAFLFILHLSLFLWGFHFIIFYWIGFLSLYLYILLY